MKKLVLASVAMVAACSGSLVCSPAFAQGADGQAAQGGLPASCTQVTIKDAAEYNDYANATSQSAPQAKADAIEAFLQKYPNSAAKAQMLEALMGAYQSISAAKTLDAAKRLLQVEPNNLRALTFVVYLEHQQSNGNQQMLDDAASWAQKGLNAPQRSVHDPGRLRQGQGSRHPPSSTAPSPLTTRARRTPKTPPMPTPKSFSPTRIPPRPLSFLPSSTPISSVRLTSRKIPKT
jgi:hypothetical protein